jgi:hypothetical protein
VLVLRVVERGTDLVERVRSDIERALVTDERATLPLVHTQKETDGVEDLDVRVHVDKSEVVVSGLHGYGRALAVAQGKGVVEAHHTARAALIAANMAWSRTRQAASDGASAAL